MTRTDNVVGTLLQVIGVLIVVIYIFRALVVVGMVGGGVAFDLFLQGVVIGVLFVGFGEALKLLQGLFNQREPEPPRIERPIREGDRVLHETNEKTVSATTKNHVMEFYAQKGLTVDEVEGTPYKGYVIVHRGEKREIIDLNGFKPEILSDVEVERHPDLRKL